MIERGLVKPEDRGSVNREGVTGVDELPAPAEKPLHGKDLSRRLTAHRTAAVQIELARNPVAALAVLMHRLIPVVFDDRYVCVYDQHAADVRAVLTQPPVADSGRHGSQRGMERNFGRTRKVGHAVAEAFQ